MIQKKKYSTPLFLLILLLALPALACSTLTGNDGEDETAVELVEPAQSAIEDLQLDESESAPVEVEVPPAGQEENNTEDEGIPAEVVEPTETSVSVEGDVGEGPAKDSSDIREEIVGALQSAIEVDAMRMHMVTEDQNSGLVTEITLAFIRPDRYQMSSEGVEFIIIGDTTYMSSGDGQWLTLQGTEMSSTVESTLDAFAGTDIIEERQNELAQSDINYEGKETINGVETLVYSFSEGLDGSDLFGQVRMWIGENDGLLYRQEIENSVTGAEGHILMEFEYGPDITIEPPV